jgi:transcriptional regulator with XRE-family HTH domain
MNVEKLLKERQGFGALLRERRLAMGFSQDQLASLTGLDKPRISRAECGHTVYFGDDSLNALGQALDVDPALLSLKAGKIAPEWRVLAARNAEAVLAFFRGLEQGESSPNGEGAPL